MSYSISYHSINQLKSICDKTPRGGLKDLIKDIKEGFRVQKLINQRNFLEKLKKRGEATRDCISLAKRIVSKFNSKRCKKEEVRLMNLRIAEKSQESRIQRQVWYKYSSMIESFMSLETKSYYRLIKQREISRVWRLEKSRLDSKLQKTVIDIPDIYAGIKVGDQILREQFGDQGSDPVILGGIQKTANMEAYMRLPGDFKTFGKLNKEAFEAEVETVAAKQRWGQREHCENPEESNSERRSRRDTENDDREPFRARENQVNFSRLRVTQFKSNKVIFMPSPLDARDEVKIESQRFDTLDTLGNFLRTKCDDKGVPRGSENLTRQEMLGRQEILKGVRDRGWMLYATDKSGKLVLDTKENFLKSMEPHFKSDIPATMSDVKSSEVLLNAHTKSWCKMLRVGSNAGSSQSQRIQEALKVVDCGVPPLRGLRKDHKKNFDPVSGPPCRPYMNAGLGPNANLGNIQARFLRPVKKKLVSMLGTEVCSTEEVKRIFSDYNSQERKERVLRPTRLCRGQFNVPLQSTKRIVGSMDVAALYPNCKVNPTSHNVERAIRRCGLVFKELDKEYLTRYVSVLTGGQLKDKELQKFLAPPKPRTSIKSFSNNPKPSQFKSGPLIGPENMSESDIRALLAIAAGKAVKAVMTNHYFSIGGGLYRQKDGGSIGLDLTVELASIYMSLWDESFNKKCKALGIKLDVYCRYVDDTIVVCGAIGEGWYFDKNDNALKYSSSHRYSQMPEDARTMHVLMDIANTVDKNIRMEPDYGSKYVSGRIPVLDLEVWVDSKNKVQQ